MNTRDFLIFQRYERLSQAKEFGCVLSKYNIAYVIEKTGYNEHAVLVRKEEETMVNRLIENDESGYQWLSFSNEKLIALIDQQLVDSDHLELAVDILKIRIREINREYLHQLTGKRLESECKQARLSGYWFAWGYLTLLGGGVYGIVFALHVMKFKKTISTGQRLHVYAEEEREYASTLLIVACVFLLVFLTALIFYW